MAIGGKAYFILTGDVSFVQAILDAGAAIIASQLAYKAVIPAPLWTCYLDTEGIDNIRWKLTFDSNGELELWKK